MRIHISVFVKGDARIQNISNVDVDVEYIGTSGVVVGEIGLQGSTGHTGATGANGATGKVGQSGTLNSITCCYSKS